MSHRSAHWRPQWRRARRGFALIAAAALVGSGLSTVAAQPALAVAGQIPDPGLAQCVNYRIDQSRPADQPITLAEVESLSGNFVCNAASQAGAESIRSFEGFAPAGVRIVSITAGLADLSAPDALVGLGELKKLTQLTLIGAGLTDASLTHIAQLTGLWKLVLQNNAAITTIAPLAPLTAMEQLDVQGIGALTSLRGVEGMAGLKNLFATGSPIGTTAPLAGLTQLETVALQNTSLRDVDGLAGSKGLTTLIVTANPELEWNYDAVAGNAGLNILKADRAGLTSLRFLEAATGLSLLEARSNAIASLEGVHDSTSFTLLAGGQQIPIAQRYFVPVDATRYVIDATGQLSMRDGVTFPGVDATIVDENGPILDIPVAPAGSVSTYGFEARPGGSQHFAGSVQITHDRVDLDGSEVPGTALLGKPFAGTPIVVNASQGGTPEPGFVVDRFELAAGAPAWLSIDKATGELSGTPTERGETSFTVYASDALGNRIAKTFELRVAETPVITLEGGLPQSLRGEAYPETTVTAIGSPELTWSATGLPSGLTIDGGTGKISGVPTAAGEFSVTVTVSNPFGETSETYRLRIGELPAITLEGGLPGGTVGAQYPVTIVTATGTAVLAWSATGLPAGLTIDAASGAISGTPEAAGRFRVTVTVVNEFGSRSATYTVTIEPREAPIVPPNPGGDKPEKPGPGKPGKPDTPGVSGGGTGAAGPISATGSADMSAVLLGAAGVVLLAGGALLAAAVDRAARRKKLLPDS